MLLTRDTLRKQKYNLAHQLTQEIPSHSIKIIVVDFSDRGFTA